MHSKYRLKDCSAKRNAVANRLGKVRKGRRKLTILPYDIEKAEIDQQDIDEAKAVFKSLTKELNDRQKIKNIFIVQTMTAAWTEFELKNLSQENQEICIEEIRELLQEKLPRLFQTEANHMNEANEVDYCLWKHFKAFYEQSVGNKIADFGEPCSDCKIWEKCKGNWIDKIGKAKPKEISINVGRVPE